MAEREKLKRQFFSSSEYKKLGSKQKNLVRKKEEKNFQKFIYFLAW